MGKIGDAIAVTTAGLSLLACSPETHEANPALPGIQPRLERIPGESFRGFLRHDAAINIIFVPTTERDPDALLEHFALDDQEQLRSGDEAFLQGISRVWKQATAGRYIPEDISVEETPLFDSGSGCVDRNDHEAVERLRTHAAPYFAEDTMNVVAIGQPLCEPQFAAFTGTDDVPIMGLGTFYAFGEVLAHEGGHAGNLDHSGLLVCNDPVRPGTADCELYETSDVNSIMSYVRSEELVENNRMERQAARFTTPELYELDLLAPEEVITNPAAGEYNLHSIESENLAPKLLIFMIAEKVLYISWEPDPTARFDIGCWLAGENPGIEARPDFLYFLEDPSLSIDDRYACLRLNERDIDNSVQVRIHDINAGNMLLVTRPGRVLDGLGEIYASGEVTPGTVVYEDNERRITFVAVNSQDEAVIQIEEF